MTKFKPIVQEEQKIEESDLSENQKRKIEKQRLKKEAEDKAAKEEEERKRQEKIKAQKAKEEREAEERRLKTEMIFRGMAAANEAKSKGQTASTTNFESIMQEQAVSSKKQMEKE